MSEPYHPTGGAKEQLDPMHATTAHTELSAYGYPQSPEDKEQRTQPLSSRTPNKAPCWLRPFFSMRIQLTCAYSLILLLMIVFMCLLAYQQPSPLYVSLAAIIVSAVGSAMAFILTTLLLRPLMRVTDAAQAIAVGDLEQRERLPLRLPPQDEIDRLAGSIDVMVTRLEHASETQRASEENFRRFFSDASHQLRTPLTSIRGFTELLMRGARDDPETAQRILMRMKNEGERMTNLINDLLTLARLDNKHPLKLQYIDLVDLAVASIEQTRARANDERKITLTIATQERLGLQADQERMKQMLFILLDNALKYGRSTPDGLIILKLDKQKENCIITVTDNGEGIAKEDLEHIFEAFYRGHYRTANSGSTTIGAGLGLTIAYEVAHAHHGTITVYSELGKGTEFKVILPCVA